MTRHTGPRAGSRAHLALVKLHQISGTASSRSWLNALTWCGSIKSFDTDVVKVLLDMKMIFSRGFEYAITDEGLEHLGIAIDAPPRPAPVIVESRYVAPKRELSRKNMPNVRLQREGSFDYRDLPSRHGHAYVDYKSSLKVDSHGAI